MVRIDCKPIEVPEGMVLRSKGFYPGSVEVLPVTATINPAEFALIQEVDDDVAISMNQHFNNADDGRGLKYFPMIQEAKRQGLVLATQKRLFQHLMNVNSALKGETALYDASGKIIEGKELAEYAQGLYHNRWVYLNGRFPKNEEGKGFRGLDLVIVNADGTEKREPLLHCLETSCYAELASMNEQGQLTRKDSVQKYKPGENIRFYPPVLRQDSPEEGYVARLYAEPDYACANCGRHPDYACASLGGIVCAEGAVAEK